MEQFFISDLHFGHKNVLAYDNRPFPSVEAHDQALIDRWNRAVSIRDEVYILGDLSYHGAVRTGEILDQLNGVKHLLVGNHDHKLLRNRDIQARFVEVADYKELSLGDNRLVLCHFPIPCFNDHYYGAYHLYGHVHTGFEYNMMRQAAYQMRVLYGKPCNMFNVGCMVPQMDYTPRTLEEIQGFLKEELSHDLPG